MVAADLEPGDKKNQRIFARKRLQAAYRFISVTPVTPPRLARTPHPHQPRRSPSCTRRWAPSPFPAAFGGVCRHARPTQPDRSRRPTRRRPRSCACAGDGAFETSRLSESNRRPIHYEFVLDAVLGRVHAAGACHVVHAGMAVEGGRGHVGGTFGEDADPAGLRIDHRPAAREGAAQKALDPLSRAGCRRQVAVEVGSGPPWDGTRAATAGVYLVQAPVSRRWIAEAAT